MIKDFQQYYKSDYGLSSLIGIEQIYRSGKVKSCMKSLQSKYGKINKTYLEFNEIVQKILERNHALAISYPKILRLNGILYSEKSIEIKKSKLSEELVDLENYIIENKEVSYNTILYHGSRVCAVLDSIFNFDTEIKEYVYGYFFGGAIDNIVRVVNFNDKLNTLEYNFKILDNIDEKYFDLSISDLIFNNRIVERFNSLGVFTLRELSKMNRILVAILLEDEFLEFENTLYYFFENPLSINILLERNIDELEEKLKSVVHNGYEIFCKRNGISDGEIKTLESIGQEYGKTRERIRQIETKANDVVLKNSNKIIKIINFFIEFSLKDDCLFLEDSILCKKFENIRYYYFVLTLLKIFQNENISNYVYDKEYHIVYKKDCLDEILSEVDLSAKYVEMKNYKKMNSFERSVINFEYRLKNNVYIRKNVNEVELLNDIIDELFPNGCKISDESSFNIIIKNFEEKYGYKYDCSIHALASNLERYNYCLVNRGTYLNRNVVPRLDNDMLNEILSYIDLNAPVITYNAIFEKFQDEFKILGIDNRYYVKGVLDYQLPKDYSTSKDYITIGEKDLTYREIFINYVNSLSGIFSVNDLKNRFSGIKDYTIYSIITSMGNILFLEDNQFISLKSLKIEDSDVAKFKNYIEEYLSKKAVDCVSINKLYVSMKINQEELLEKITYINSAYRLFSLFKILFNGLYEFKRPYIGIIGKKEITKYSLLKERAYEFEQFDVKQIYSDVERRIGLKSIYGIREFIEDLSIDYVQYKRYAMVRKKNMLLSDDIINKIKSEIDYYINSYSEIDTRTYRAYQLLPTIKYAWNKYLMVGIIRTYLNDFYKIEYTDCRYDRTDYIIRRNK